MASTFRSHFRHLPQSDDSAPQARNNSNTRAPATFSSNETEGKPTKPMHVSRLTKRSSKSIAASDKIEHGSWNTKRASTSVTVAPALSTQTRKRSITPSGVEPSGIQNSTTSRSNTPCRPPTAMPTPSLVSGSSASSHENLRSTHLRRKPSTIERHVASERSGTPAKGMGQTMGYKQDIEYDGAFEDTVLGISLPASSYSTFHGGSILHSPDAADSHLPNFTPPVIGYAPSATPSTRYTDSPFSHVPTPSSASSYSSSVLAPSSSKTPRSRQPSPTRSRPPVATKVGESKDSTRLGLPPLRESSTSSSNSTVKPSQSRPAVPSKDAPRKSATAPPPGQNNDQTRPASRGRLVKERPRKSSTDNKAKATPQIPPELAHLNVEPPSKPTLNKALPPIRPSREGTPNLSGISNPSPVVQSDLPKLYTSYHKRTPSQETPTSPSFKSRFGLSSRSSSRQPSPRIDSAISPPPAARTFTRGPTPDPVPSNGPKLSRNDSPAVGPGPSPSKSSRFGFFSRKPKEMTKPLEKPKRKTTKGPAAGTGHEGYGRFGFRGRSGSTTSGGDVRSPSTDSNTSSQPARKSTSRQSSVGSKEGSDLDDFLKERLNPVYLRGSGSTVSAAASTSDGQSSGVAPSSKTSSLDSYPTPQLLPSAMSDTVHPSPSKQRIPSDSSDDDTPSRYAAPTSRHSFNQRTQDAQKSTAPLPTWIDTKLPFRKVSVGSHEPEAAATHRVDNQARAAPMEGKEGLWLRDRLDDPTIRQARKWNFLQRAQASPRSKGKGRQAEATGDSGFRGLQGAHHTPSHYTMLGPMDQVDLDEVERIAQENFTSPDDSTSENASLRVVPYEDRHSSLLPSPPKLELSRDADFRARPTPPRITIRQDSADSSEVLHAQRAVPNLSPSLVEIERSPIIGGPDADSLWPAQQSALPQRDAYHTPEMPQVPFTSPDKADTDGSPRQPRLSPVGRIPKVVSKRDRERKLSDTSFSRPFIRTQPRPTVKPPGSLYSEIRELASPVEPSSGSQPVSSTSTNSNGGSGDFKSSLNTNAPSASTARTSMDMHAHPEFFAFPPRKDSDLSYSTSSGHNSYLAPMMGNSLHEDEIWSEYNDLMDDVLNHNTPLSTGSSLGAPFHYSHMLHEPASTVAPHPLNWRQPPAEQLPSIPRPETTPAVLSVPQQISRFMQPSMSPLTPHTLADFYDQYGNPSMSALSTANRSSIPSQYRSSITAKGRSSFGSQNRSSLAQPANRSSLPGARDSMASSRYSRSSGHSRSASLPEANVRNSQSSLTQSSRFNRDTQLLDIAEVDGDEQAADANLRFGALMTSKWLSNGRVLFSPAHNEMRLADEPRVLIIDGLGSDWSFYVALSYPAASVYNLGPEISASWPGISQLPPSNHRHITHAAISAAFPFPKGFFTAVVFRFPAANNDDAFQAFIFECKRVLRPGGHLEVTVLDLDLNCMGNKARKAVRGLKTRMQQQDSSVSLRNTSDFLLRIIGRRGFEEVQRCVVGVPSAGRIPGSQDISNRSSQESGKHGWHRESLASQEFSFADLLEDARANQMESDTRKNDEGITKTVAKVGRWWYSSCYERALPQTDNSIWNDQALLRECEKQGTSFRLLICHAQKPTQTRRRTVSV